MPPATSSWHDSKPCHAAVGQYIDALRWARENADRFSGTGIAPVRQLDTLADQVELWVAADWFGSVPIDEDVDAATRTRVRDAGDRANTALTELIAVLRDELRPAAPTVDAVGAEVYADLAASMLGARIDIADTYAYGWAELERLVSEARNLAKELGGTGEDPVRSAAALLDEDPRYRLDGVEAIRSWLELRVGETTDALAPAFDLPPGIRRCRLRRRRGLDRCRLLHARAARRLSAQPDRVDDSERGAGRRDLAGGDERAPRRAARPPPAVRRDGVLP